MTEHAKWWLVLFLKLIERTPLEWNELSNKSLSWVSLTSEIYLLWFNLVRDIDQQYIEVVVWDMIRLEQNLHLIFFVGFDCACTWDHYERHLFLFILNTLYKTDNIEVDWEWWHIFDSECLDSPAMIFPKAIKPSLGLMCTSGFTPVPLRFTETIVWSENMTTLSS